MYDRIDWGSMIHLIKDVWSHRNIVLSQISVELKLSTADTRLGYLWWIVDPVVMMAVYYFVVHVLMQRGGDDFHVFLLSALVAWQWFAKSVNAGTAAFPRSSALIAEVHFPLSLLLLVPIMVNGIYVFFGFIVVVLFVWRVPGPELIFLIPVMAVQAVLTLGIICFLAVLNVYLRDIQRIIGFILRAWWFLSPVLYSADLVLNSDKVSDTAKTLFMLNPFATLLPAYREILLRGNSPDWTALAFWGVLALGILQLSYMLLRSKESQIAKYV